MKHNVPMNPWEPFYLCRLSLKTKTYFPSFRNSLRYLSYMLMLHESWVRFSSFYAHRSLSDLSLLDFLLCSSVCTSQSAKKRSLCCMKQTAVRMSGWCRVQSLYVRLLSPSVDNQSPLIPFLLLAVGNYGSVHLFFCILPTCWVLRIALKKCTPF